MLNAGADKISVNSAVVRRPDLVSEIASRFGSQCVVVAVDAKNINGVWKVFLNGGRIETELALEDWVKQLEKLGAGEILFTSMNHDGTKNGFACEELARISDMISIPVIASGGAGKPEHFLEAFTKGKADAALAASVFHFKEIEIKDLKNYLAQQQIPVRL